MAYDTLTGWEIVAQGAFVIPEKGLRWDEGKWDDFNWNDTASDDMWTDLTCSAINASVRAGASQTNGVLTRYESSTLDMELTDVPRLLDPFNPNGLAQFGRMRPRAGIRLRVRHNSEPAVWYYLFTGFMESLVFDYSTDRAKIVGSDAVGYLAKYDTPEAIPTVGDGDTAAQRIGRILDLAAWPASRRRITAGGSVFVASDMKGATWNQALGVAESDFGLLTVDPTGVVVYVPGSGSPWGSTLKATIGSGSGLALLEANAVEDDASLINSVTAAKAGGAQYRYDDSVSASLYGYGGEPVWYPHAQTDLPLKNDVDVIAWAKAILGVHAYPAPRISPLGIELAEQGKLISDPVAWKAIAGLRIGDRLRVRCDPLTIDEDQHVRGWQFDLEHDARSLIWKGAIVTTSAKWSTPMIWNDDRYGYWDEFMWG